MNATEQLLRRVGGAKALRSKFRGALVGALVGDAFGAVFEGHGGTVPEASLTELERSHSALRYTDDTALTIALAESVLFVGHLDEDHLAGTMARFEREPLRGYGAAAATLLRRVARGESWKAVAEAQFGGQGSFGNGAAMRVAPLALFAQDPAAAAALARRSARVTHTHPLAVDGAGVQAAAVALALAQPASELLDRPAFFQAVAAVATEPILGERLAVAAQLAPHAPPEEIARRLGTGVEAHQAVPAALCAFMTHPESYRQTVRFAIAMGGDTDTIASMAGAIAGARLGEEAIPAPWLARTEAAADLRELADRLLRRAADNAGLVLSL